MATEILTPVADKAIDANDLPVGTFGIVVDKQFRGHIVRKHAAGVIDYDDPNNEIAADFALLVQPQATGFAIKVVQD